VVAPPHRTCVRIPVWAALALLAIVSAAAADELEHGLYNGQDWQAGPATDLSASVRFRLRLPAIPANEGPSTAFAVHTSASQNPWQVVPGTARQGGSQNEYIWDSPEFQTAGYPDGEWTVYCRLDLPVPGGGGEPDMWVPDRPVEPEAEVAPMSVDPPPGGWPPGFIPQGDNYRLYGPLTFTTKNLTILEASVVMSHCQESEWLFFAAGRDGWAQWIIRLADGSEVLTSDRAVTATMELLHKAGPASQDAEGHHDLNDAPGSAEGEITEPAQNAPRSGLYAKHATATEVSGDSADTYGDWSVSGLTASLPICNGARQAKVRVTATLSTTETPTDAEYVHYQPFSQHGIGDSVGPLLEEPSVSESSSVGGDPPRRTIVAVLGDGNGMHFDLAGPQWMGAGYCDNETYHAPGVGRWTPPEVTSVTIPACALYGGRSADDEAYQWTYDVQAYAYGLLGDVQSPNVGPPSRSFYSGRDRLGIRGGVVMFTTGTFDVWRLNFLAACHEDLVIGYNGHGVDGDLYVGGGQFIYASDIPDMSQALLAFLDCCEGAAGTNSVAAAMDANHCKAVIAYTENVKWAPDGHAAGTFARLIWENLARHELSAVDAVDAASDEWQALYPSETLAQWGLDSVVVWGSDPDVRIAPAPGFVEGWE